MPANEFERQVQKRLDDFELNPSASVWKKVEDKIRKKKRRRIIIFFLLLAVFLTGSYSVYYFSQSAKNNKVVQQNPVRGGEKNDRNIQNDPGRGVQQPSTIQNPMAGSPSTEATTKNSHVFKINTPGETERGGVTISLNDPALIHGKHRQPDGQNIPAAENKEKRMADATYSSNINSKQSQPDSAMTAAQPATSVNAGNEQQENISMVPKINNDHAKSPTSHIDPALAINHIESKDSLSVVLKEPILTDSVRTNDIGQTVAEEIQLPKRKYRVKWGINFSAGVSLNRSEVFSINKSSDRTYAISSPGTVSATTPFATPNGPSAIKPGAAFKIGVTAERQFSPRSRLSTGIQYSYASNSIRKGGVVYALLPVQNNSNFSMTRADQVYHGSPQNSYTNSFHFLSMPLGYHWHINRSKKLPVEWNAGVSFNYLLATNALVFNSSYGGIYYRDKNAISKMHINVGTGFSIRLKSKKGMEWVMGPEVYFDTKKLVISGNDARQYLFFAGMDVKLFFKQKKK